MAISIGFPMWIMDLFELPGLGLSISKLLAPATRVGSYSGSRHRLSWRDFFPLWWTIPLIGKLTMMKQLSLVSMIYLYISISYLFIYLFISHHFWWLKPQISSIFQAPFPLALFVLLKLGDFVVGSQELLVARGLDHVVVVRNLLQLGLAARNHGRW